MHTRMKCLGLVSAILLALPVMSCSDTAVAPNSTILAGGAAERAQVPVGTLTWLPALGTGTANPTTFDAAAVSHVDICVWVAGACSGATVATFTTTPTAGAGTLTANTAVGQYEANWSLMGTNLAIRKTYRIRAMQGTTEIGGILVDVVRGRWGLTLSGGALAALSAASELDIRFHVAVVPLVGVVINEVESNGGVPDDWVELYNPTGATIDLSNFEFRDNDDTHHFFLPAGTTIASGAYLVLDGNNPNDPTKFSFGLGSTDMARLFDQYGRLVDSYSWTSHALTTYGRCPNGTGPFVTTTSSTKGAANDCSNPVRINEVESNDPTPGPDWIELYNPSGIPVSLAGDKLKDNDGNSFTIPSGVTIAAGGFLTFTQNATGSFTFGLGSNDGATLTDASDHVIDTYSWTSHATTTYGRCPDGTGPFVTMASVTKNGPNNCGGATNVRLNEIESSDPAGGPDWIELINTGSTLADLSGYKLKDNDGNSFTIPNSTTIAAGALLVFTQNAANSFTFGLSSADGATLTDPGNNVIDSFSWTMHSPTTYGRCPDPIGTGTTPIITTVAATKGAANSCPTAWPGGTSIATVDIAGTFSSNLSGLMYEIGTGGAPDAMWGARNGPGSLYRLILSGGNWIPDPANGWGSGKLVHYTNGLGEPDFEDLTFTSAGSAGGIYAATERDNQNGGVSRPSVLRYDPTSPSAELTATNDWNLTADLPVVGANLGLEAIAWIPDTYLTSKGFVDDHAGHAYNPSDYPNHGAGLFFVGLEGNGVIYVYALNTDNTFTRITSFFTGFPMGVMSMQWDGELGHLWTTCDDTCGGLSDIWDIDTTPGSPTLGHFNITHIFNRPSGMPNFNNEGFGITPLSFCSGGLRPVFWSDDSNDANHSIRQGSLTCNIFP